MLNKGTLRRALVISAVTALLLTVVMLLTGEIRIYSHPFDYGPDGKAVPRQHIQGIEYVKRSFTTPEGRSRVAGVFVLTWLAVFVPCLVMGLRERRQ